MSGREAPAAVTPRPTIAWALVQGLNELDRIGICSRLGLPGCGILVNSTRAQKLRHDPLTSNALRLHTGGRCATTPTSLGQDPIQPVLGTKITFAPQPTI